MTSLQCPATLLLATPGTETADAGLRVAHVWSVEEAPGLTSTDHDELRDELADIADRTPGETTVVPFLDDRLRAALPRLARTEVDPGELRDAAVLALVIDADDWVVRAHGVST